MYVIIVGGGKMGYSLAKELAIEKHDVVIVEADEKRCQKLARELNATIIHGNGTELKTLEEAGLEKADAVVALTPRDEVNLMVCLMAKNKKHCKTAARVSQPEYEKVFKELGIDIVVYPEVAAADYLEELLTKPGVVDLAFISRGNAVILEFDVKKGSKAIGKEIRELEYPRGSLIIGIYEDDNLIFPSPETRIKEGDRVLVIAKNEVVDKVRKIFSI